MQYSGRTSAYAHKHVKWQDKDYSQMAEYQTDGELDWHKVPHQAKPALSQRVVFDAQWTDCPVEVEAEVKRLWRDRELGNDHYYVSWDSNEMSADYPVIDEYLKANNVTKCLIHWWW